MKHVILIILFIGAFVTSTSAFSLPSDSSGNNQNGQSRLQDSADIGSEESFYLDVNSLDIDTSNYQMFRSFPLKLQILSNQAMFFDKSAAYHNLYLSSSLTGSYFEDNKNKMFGSFYNFYELSKPTKMQQVLGMVQLSGAAFLAGYHIYKYYIKKKD